MSTKQKASDRAPEVTVIIPVLDGAQHIGEQLQALAMQEDAPSFEVIVVDNGSSDATRDVVRSFVDGYPVPLRLLDGSARRGIAYGRNAGVLAARAPLLGMCDADDHVAPHWVSGVRDGLARHEAVGGPLRELRTPFDPAAPRLSHESIQRAPEGANLIGCNWAIRRELFERAGGLDESMPPYGGEDLELSLRLTRLGADIGREEKLEIYFRATPRGRDSLQKIYKTAIAQALMYRKHPQRFPEHQGRTALLRELLRLPVSLVRAVRRGGISRAARITLSLGSRVLIRLRGQDAPREALLLDQTAPAPDITAQENPHA